MELKEIRQIIELMKKNDLSFFHLQKEDFNIKLKKGVDLEDVLELLRGQGTLAHGAPPTAAVTPPPGEPAATGSEKPEPAAPEDDSAEITSPMVGTLYRASSPESDPFVQVGTEVEESTTVCIIEAMKVMNEIKADVKGVITKIHVDDATAVQYGQPLFLVNPS